MDLTPALLPVLRRNRLPGLELGDDFIYPAYSGQSILNIPASVCQLFDLPPIAAAPLNAEILAPLQGPVQRVILILMDALSLHRLQRWMSDGTAPVWTELAQNGLLAPLTSITPSTTSAALTSLWTGRPAVEHGILGYEMWLKEYGVVANTILHAPITYQNDIGSLAKAGFKPVEFMPLPTLGVHLARHGVRSHAFQHFTIARSGLSQMLFQDVDVHGFGTAAELWLNVRRLLESRPDERLYSWVYWSEVDHFSHLYGPDDERTQGEFALFSLAMQRFFLERLPAALRRGTLLILAADHGQIATPPDPHYELRNHTALARRLHIQPTGENRLMLLFVRPGQTESVREYLERTWPNQFVVLDASYAAGAGLFGSGTAHPRLPDRLGEYVVVARNGAYLWWADKENFLLGRHGGLHPDEMLVPFLATPLA